MNFYEENEMLQLSNMARIVLLGSMSFLTTTVQAAGYYNIVHYCGSQGQAVAAQIRAWGTDPNFTACTSALGLKDYAVSLKMRFGEPVAMPALSAPYFPPPSSLPKMPMVSPASSSATRVIGSSSSQSSPISTEIQDLYRTIETALKTQIPGKWNDFYKAATDDWLNARLSVERSEENQNLYFSLHILTNLTIQALKRKGISSRLSKPSDKGQMVVQMKQRDLEWGNDFNLDRYFDYMPNPRTSQGMQLLAEYLGVLAGRTVEVYSAPSSSLPVPVAPSSQAPLPGADAASISIPASAGTATDFVRWFRTHLKLKTYGHAFSGKYEDTINPANMHSFLQQLASIIKTNPHWSTTSYSWDANQRLIETSEAPSAEGMWLRADPKSIQNVSIQDLLTWMNTKMIFIEDKEFGYIDADLKNKFTFCLIIFINEQSDWRSKTARWSWRIGLH